MSNGEKKSIFLKRKHIQGFLEEKLQKHEINALFQEFKDVRKEKRTPSFNPRQDLSVRSSSKVWKFDEGEPRNFPEALFRRYILDPLRISNFDFGESDEGESE